MRNADARGATMPHSSAPDSGADVGAGSLLTPAPIQHLARRVTGDRYLRIPRPSISDL